MNALDLRGFPGMVNQIAAAVSAIAVSAKGNATALRGKPGSFTGIQAERRRKDHGGRCDRSETQRASG